MHTRFTDDARKMMQRANKEAQKMHHEYVGPEHILLGIVTTPSEGENRDVGFHMLKHFGIDPDLIRRKILRRTEPEMARAAPLGRLPYTQLAQVVIEYALQEARTLGHDSVGTEAVLIGLLNTADGVACQILRDEGLTLEKARGYLRELPKEASELPEAATFVMEQSDGVFNLAALQTWLDAILKDHPGATFTVKAEI